MRKNTETINLLFIKNSLDYKKTAHYGRFFTVYFDEAVSAGTSFSDGNLNIVLFPL